MIIDSTCLGQVLSKFSCRFVSPLYADLLENSTSHTLPILLETSNSFSFSLIGARAHMHLGFLTAVFSYTTPSPLLFVLLIS